MAGEDRQSYIDVETALGRVRGNKTLYGKMLKMFLDSGEFGALDAALEEGNYARASEVAHGIKGMTGNLGLTQVFATSEELMQQLKQGPASEEALQAYRTALAATREQVQQLIEELAT